MFGPNYEFDPMDPFVLYGPDGPDGPEPEGYSVADLTRVAEPPTLHQALASCRNAVRAAAAVEPNGGERGRLDALADVLAAELRVQRQRG